MIGVAAVTTMVPNPGPAATVIARKNWSGGWKSWAAHFSNHFALTSDCRQSDRIAELAEKSGPVAANSPRTR